MWPQVSEIFWLIIVLMTQKQDASNYTNILEKSEGKQSYYKI